MGQFIGIAMLGAVAVLSASVTGGAAQMPAASPSGFQLPAFSGAYPGRTFIFVGDEARQLTREILPLVTNDVTRVSVTEDIMLPGSFYYGFSVDIALKVVGGWSDTICEERHAIVTFKYAAGDVRASRVKVKDGAASDHAFEGFGWGNRYMTLREKGLSQAAAQQKCETLADDTSGWKRAASATDYIDESRRLSALMIALQNLPMSRIRCVGADNKPCGHDRAKLIAIIQATPPERSDAIFLPGEGRVSVYGHYGYEDPAKIDYDATLRSDAADRPRSLDIRFSNSAPPPVV